MNVLKLKIECCYIIPHFHRCIKNFWVEHCNYIYIVKNNTSFSFGMEDLETDVTNDICMYMQVQSLVAFAAILVSFSSSPLHLQIANI